MNWRDRSGLTLMELLVALALVAVITGGLASATNLGVQLLNRTQSLEETNPQLALRTRLRHWITTATSPAMLASFETGLSGDVSGFSFVTITPAPFAPKSAALRITLSNDLQEFSLQIEELDDAGQVIKAHAGVLATAVEGAMFSYYTDNPEAPGWQNAWNDPNRLPLLIRITADEGSTPEWPEFTVRLAFAQER